MDGDGQRNYFYLSSAGSDSGVVEARRSTVNSQFQRGHNRSHSSGTDPNSAVRSPVHTASYPTQTKAKSQEIQRQCSAPQSSGPVNAHHPDSMGFKEILSNLDQLTKQLDDSCSNPSSSIGRFAKGMSIQTTYKYTCTW